MNVTNSSIFMTSLFKMTETPHYIYNDFQNLTISGGIARYHKCNIQGPNNQLKNCFINLFRFNCLVPNFCFLKKYNFWQARENDCYGCVPFVLVIKCTLENVGGIIKFWGNAHCHKMYLNADSSQRKLNLHGLYFLRYLEYLSVDDISQETHENLRKTRL